MLKGQTLNRKCTVEGCHGKHMAKGLCIMHYARMRRHGDLLPWHDPPRKPIKERFEERYIPVPESGCWIWTGHIRTNGYGAMSIKSKLQYAHRISWELHNGPIPEGLFVLHKCDNPPCVNPDHLFIGTQKDNLQDAFKKGRLYIFTKEDGKKGCLSRWGV